MPKLSIITINLNNVDGLKKTIESVVHQTFLNYELIIIDGGSTDGSVEIIKKHSNKINFWVSETDQGIYNAMNKGIKQAKGEYCLFLNSGDYLYDKNILTDIFTSGFKEEIIYGDVFYLYKDRQVKIEYPNADELSFSFFRFRNLTHSSTFIKKILFDRYGLYDEKKKIVSDWEFLILVICKFNVTIKKISNIVSYYDTTGLSSISGNKEIITTEREKVLNNNFKYFINDYKRKDRIEDQIKIIKENLIVRVCLFIKKLIKI